MLCGRSNNTGIMIYDSRDLKGVYGTYDHDEIVLIEGSVKQLEEYYKEHSNKKNLHKIMLISLMIEVLISIYSLLHLSFTISFSLILFFVLSYIKLNTIIYTFVGKYENKEEEKQFKRFHACEHKLLNIDGEVTLEKLQNASMFHIDCGTVHACNIVVFYAILCFNLANIFNIGILKFIINIIILIIILIINLFNPYNPFFLVQRQVVSEPTIHEYELALKIAERLNIFHEKA